MGGIDVLVIGSGGREHAIVRKITQSDLVDNVYCAPGNFGTGVDGVNLPVNITDVKDIAQIVSDYKIRLTVIGPEGPLVGGVVDYFHNAGLVKKGHLIVGPNRAAARLEGSKAFAKEVMDLAGVSTAHCDTFSKQDHAIYFAKQIIKDEGGVVIKADGLAAGKGVFVCNSETDIGDAFNAAIIQNEFNTGGGVVVEKRLQGPEFSYIALCGGGYVPLAGSRDHKRLLYGDKGPNTGGMGAFSPTCVLDGAVEKNIGKDVIVPVVDYLREADMPFAGFLYVGGMMTEDGPKVLEFNVRMGDPETQPLMMRMKSDIVPYLLASAEGNIDDLPPMKFYDKSACCVVMASEGYPDDYETGRIISGLRSVSLLEDVVAFHAGTTKQGNRIVTSGGRVLGVTALGDTLVSARTRAYKACAMIHWEGSFYRRDIGSSEIDDKGGVTSW